MVPCFDFPSLAVRSSSLIEISAADFDLWHDMSIPISRSTAIASGLTDVGRDPADQIFIPEGARERAIPSAIWLRAEFATHRNRTLLT
jgi:hypothetical protein